MRFCGRIPKQQRSQGSEPSSHGVSRAVIDERAWEIRSVTATDREKNNLVRGQVLGWPDWE
jgi:hypothetical protein